MDIAAAFDDPQAAVRAALAAGRRPIRTIGSDAPFDLLCAAGFQPVRMVPCPGPTPLADALMGQNGLGPRGRSLLDMLLSPDARDVPVLITSATAEQVQLFATLRELERLGEATPPPMHLLDLRHQPRAASRAYTHKRLADCSTWLADLPAGTAETVDAGHRALLDNVDALRRADPARISGTDMLQAAGAMLILPPAEHRAALSAIVAGAPRPGPRLFLTGSAHDDTRLYRAIEALGCTIVGEDHDWGVPLPPSTLPPSPLPPCPLSAALPGAVAARVAARAKACAATHILHLSLEGDEAAPWTAPAIARAVDLPFFAAREGQPEAIARFLAGEAQPAAPPRPPKPATPRPPKPATPRPPRAADPSRSRKALASVAGFGAYQREWFASVRERAATGEPFAVVNANAPQEILRALDIPFVVNQWWASIVAAKQQSGRYIGLLRAHDYPASTEPYSAQGLAAALDDDAGLAPWGGLPKPDFLHAVLSSDATMGIFGNWAAETGADGYCYERSVDPRRRISTDWWAELPDGWEEALEPARIDLMTAELQEMIARLETATGRSFDPARFEEVMHLVNEQEDYYRRTRDLIANAPRAPIGIVDSMPATMVPQWHRGTLWARDAARAFHDEVAARVAEGAGAVPDEKVRLMWIGRGMWSEMGFYQQWEESHGAVFIWSMYLALAADGYIRHFDRGRDPLRALAARFLTMGDELRLPGWAGPWHVHEARTHRVDGAVALADADPFVLRAIADAGIPLLDLNVDNFYREDEDADAIAARITAFIEGPATAMATRRRAA